MKRKKRKIVRVIVIAVLVICLGMGAYMAYGAYQMSRLPSMTFEDMLAYTTRNTDGARITVGIVRDGEASFTVYGKDSAVLPQTEHVYEIGSLTKTFTSSLLCKAVSEGRADLSDGLDKYLELTARDYYPTLRRLVSHTSGYREYYFEWPMAAGFATGQDNDYFGIGRDLLTGRIAAVTLEDRDYGFTYSNFGMAAVGLVLEKIYGESYTGLINAYAADDLGLTHTKVSDGTGDLGGYWSWLKDDAYIPAGGLTSTIGDMLRYIELQISGELPYLAEGQAPLAVVNATSGRNEMMGIRMDAAGIGWMLDTQNNLVWHNGGTSHYNSYAAFDRDRQLGVVILSNCSPDYRIPATVMGVKLINGLQAESGAA